MSDADTPDFSRTPLTDIADDVLLAHDIRLQVLRLDLADPALGGNKWFKLQHNLALAKTQGADTLLSFGGAYSNHLYALAEAGFRYGFRTIGVIRGELSEPLNPTLRYVQSRGMQLIPVSRSDYRHRNECGFADALLGGYRKGVMVIPEGGANLPGVQGCHALAHLLVERVADPDGVEVCLACGTGTTMAGLLAGLQHTGCFVRGFSVLKGGDFLREEITGWLQRQGADISSRRWALETDYHFGGYARRPSQLTDFIRQFEAQHDIPLEPVYTGKLMASVYQRIREGLYPPGSRLVVMHTGGLQTRKVD